MFGIDAVIIILGVILGFVAFYAYVNSLASAYEKFAGPIFLSIPTIGNAKCGVSAQNNADVVDNPAYPFGKIGYNTIGCTVAFFQPMAGIVLGFVVAINLFGIFFGRMVPWIKSHMEGIIQGGRNLVITIILFAIVVLWPQIHDTAAVFITQLSYEIAAQPHGPAKNTAELTKNSEATITFSYRVLTDASLGSHDCFKATDTDGDGLKDTVTVDQDCVKGRMFGPDLLQTAMSFIVGGNTKGILSILVYGASVIRLQITAVMASIFVLVLALSRLPWIGKFFEPIAKAYVLLMFCPILIACVYNIGDKIIVEELNHLHKIHPDNITDEKNVAFLLALGVPLSVLSVITLCMQFFAPAALALGGIAISGLNKAFEGATKLATATTAAGMGEAGQNFSTAVGHTLHTTGYGGASGSTFSIGQGGDDAQRPTNHDTKFSDMHEGEGDNKDEPSGGGNNGESGA